MTINGKWKFNHQSDGTWSSGDYHDTKEAAIEEGKSYYTPDDYETLYVGQVQAVPDTVFVDASWVLDNIAENMRDEHGECTEDYLMHVQPKDEDELSKRLSEAVNEWMEEFGHTPDFYKIVNVESFQNE